MVQNQIELYKRLAELVKEEAKNLRINATAEELNNLTDTILSPDSPTKCLYGLMTGSCESSRAIKLINICCSVRIKNFKGIMSDNYELSESSFLKAPRRNNWSIKTENMRFSPIEVMLWLAPASDIKMLVKYLRSEIRVMREFKIEMWNYREEHSIILK